MNLTLFQLLSEKSFGLLYGDNYEQVRWFESAASECSIDMEEGEPDYDVLVLSSIKPDDYVYFRADAPVTDASTPTDQNAIHIQNIDGTKCTFHAFKILDIHEIFS